MPPRIPVWQCLRAQSSSQCPNASRAFSSTPSSQASTVTQKRRHRDPYAIAQAKARKAANLSRQEVLKQERASVLGDPVRGTTTPFVQSFDTALPPEPSASSASTETRTDESPSDSSPGPKTDTDNHLNFFLNKNELESGITRSKWLVQPLERQAAEPGTGLQALPQSMQIQGESEFSPDTNRLANSLMNIDFGDRPDYERANDEMAEYTTKETPEQREARRKEEHETAQEAIRRISSLSLGSSKDRLRVNMQRCIDVFGRHNTDSILPPKAQSADAVNVQEKDPRIGPDTGSSEVQIAILTAKIRALADGLELRGHPDKVNKRNLRLLVHRRAKLLKYLRRKERGGPRWQNLVDTLGITDGMWKGEISM